MGFIGDAEPWWESCPASMHKAMARAEETMRGKPVGTFQGVPVYDPELWAAFEAWQESLHADVVEIERETLDEINRLKARNAELEALKASREHMFQQESKRVNALADEIVRLERELSNERAARNLAETLAGFGPDRRMRAKVLEEENAQLREQVQRLTERLDNIQPMTLDEEVDRMADALVKADGRGEVAKKMSGFDKVLAVISFVVVAALGGAFYEMTGSVLATVIATVVLAIGQALWTAHCQHEWRTHRR